MTPQEFALIQRWLDAAAALAYGHLERRVCTAAAPMPLADKDQYRWSHPDAVEQDLGNNPFCNAVPYECPHCKLFFMAKPRSKE